MTRPVLLALPAFALFCLFPGAASPSQTAPGDSGTRVVVLGTGTPNADPDRSGPAVAIIVNDRSYLVDAGPGIVRRAALAARTLPALRMPMLDIVFLTHLHSDHTVGLPDLMLTPWVLDRASPLRVFGPSGTTSMVKHLSQAYSADIEIRLNGGEPSNKTGYRADAKDVSPGIVYRDSNVTVTAFEVQHGSWPQAFGYRFQTRDRVIVISGDTRPSDAVVEQCNGCDVLVHEVYSATRLQNRTPAWQAYHRRYHTSTIELAQLASRAHPKLLLLYHQLHWGATDEELVAEISRTYHGPIVSARDLGIY